MLPKNLDLVLCYGPGAASGRPDPDFTSPAGTSWIWERYGWIRFVYASLRAGSNRIVRRGDIAEVVLGNRLAATDIPCGGGFEIRNLPDGNFILSAVMIGDGAHSIVRPVSSQSIDERTRGPVELRAMTPVPLAVTIEIDGAPSTDEFPRSLTDIPVLLGMEFPMVVSSAKNKGPKFETSVYPGETYRLTIGPPIGSPVAWNTNEGEYYVKQILQNGVPVVGTHTFQVFGGNLRIVLSKHPAALQAQIALDASQSQPTVRVILLKEGKNESTSSAKLVGQDGRAVFPGIEPGKYLVYAITGNWSISEMTDNKTDKFLSNATPVTLEEGQTAQVVLRPLK